MKVLLNGVAKLDAAIILIGVRQIGGKNSGTNGPYDDVEKETCWTKNIGQEQARHHY